MSVDEIRDSATHALPLVPEAATLRIIMAQVESPYTERSLRILPSTLRPDHRLFVCSLNAR